MPYILNTEQQIHSACILVVDDNPVETALCDVILRAAGFVNIVATNDPLEALALHAAHAPVLTLLDLLMPGMSGFEVLARLQAQCQDRPNVIVLSADGGKRIEALEQGAVDFVDKPYDPRELLTRVRNVLQVHALQTQLQSQVDELQEATDRLELYRSATENSLDAIFIVDAGQQCLVDANKTACDMLGYSRKALLAIPPVQLGLMPGSAEPGEARVDATARMYRADMSAVDVELRFERLASGRRDLFAATARDMNLRSEAERRLRQLAEFDTLTGLPNRRQFFASLEQGLAYAQQSAGKAAVLFIDLDRFKVINDNLGHAVGDVLLKEFSARLSRCVRARDVVARLGGDEFAVLIQLAGGSDDAATVAAKIRDVLSESFLLNHHELSITVSIGIALFPEDAATSDSLMQCADIAMYRAKDSGRNTFRYFTSAMNARGIERLELESALRKAVEQQEFVLFYQPKVASRSGKISGVEALLRWQRPGIGMVSPAEFIPLLEETGMIVRVGAWVIQSACQQIRRWIDAGVGAVSIAVNVSARQFFDDDLKASIAAALEQSGIEPDLLVLELTESILMSNGDEMVALLSDIKALGVQIAIDDFGTGYSSLAYLKRFPINSIKIDIAFVRDVIRSPEDAAITLAIIQMAHGLGLRAVAEGVETVSQLDYLRAHGCDEIQGFYFSRPMPESETRLFLTAPMALLQSEAAGVSGAPTLLVVDDDASVCEILSSVFEEDGYRVLVAPSAERGFELLASNHVDVILCDQRIPVMTGTEFFRLVKGLYPKTRRIAMSGSADRDMIAAAINEGAIAKFVAKPWNNADLRKMVAQTLAHRLL